MSVYLKGLLATAILAGTGFGFAAPAAAAALSTEGNKAAAPAVVHSTDAIRKTFIERFPGIEVSDVRPTPFPGLFEVQIGMDLLYTDANVAYVMQGALVDVQTRKDLTAERLAKLAQVPFSSLPLQHAVKQVKGDGARKMAVFEDPNCGYCKRLHETLQKVDNTTVYTFLLPILSPDSEVKARNVWCAKDQAATWKAWMLEGKTPASADCETPVKEVMALGKKLMVQGTPAIIFADGSRVNGALPQDALEKKLSGAK